MRYTKHFRLRCLSFLLFCCENQGFARLIAVCGQKMVVRNNMKTAEMESMETRRVRRSEKVKEPERFGLFGSIRRVAGTFLALIESRIELITVELREEKRRALALLFGGVALVFFAFLSFVALMGVVVFLLWDNALAVLLGFSGFFVVLALGSFFAAQSKLKKIPFGDTIAQLRKDREALSEELP